MLKDLLERGGIVKDVEALNVLRALDLGLVLFELENETDDGVILGLVPGRGRGEDATVLRGLHVRIQGIVRGSGDGES